MAIRKSIRWSLEGVFSRGRCGCAARQSGLLAFITIITSLGWRVLLKRDRLRARVEREKWRERAAMLARNLDEEGDDGPPKTIWIARRRRRAAQLFQLREVRWAQVSKIEGRDVYVEVDGLNWLVNIPELTWNEVRDASRFVSVGQTVGVKVLSIPKQSKHPFLLLLTA